MTQAGRTLNARARLQAQVEAFIAAWTPGGSGVAYTPQGLAAVGSEGVLRNAANAALVALVHARHSSGFGAVRLACWARNQVPLDSPITAQHPHAAVAVMHPAELHTPAPPCSVKMALGVICMDVAAPSLLVQSAALAA